MSLDVVPSVARLKIAAHLELADIEIAILNRGLLYVLLFGVAQQNTEGTVVGGAAMVYITM